MTCRVQSASNGGCLSCVCSAFIVGHHVATYLYVFDMYISATSCERNETWAPSARPSLWDITKPHIYLYVYMYSSAKSCQRNETWDPMVCHITTYNCYGLKIKRFMWIDLCLLLKGTSITA